MSYAYDLVGIRQAGLRAVQVFIVTQRYLEEQPGVVLVGKSAVAFGRVGELSLVLLVNLFLVREHVWNN